MLQSLMFYTILTFSAIYVLCCCNCYRISVVLTVTYYHNYALLLMLLFIVVMFCVKLLCKGLVWISSYVPSTTYPILLPQFSQDFLKFEIISVYKVIIYTFKVNDF